jgi:hypothetical protein
MTIVVARSFRLLLASGPLAVALLAAIPQLLSPPAARAAAYPCYNLSPAQLAGKTLWLAVESGSAPFESAGTVQLQLNANGTYAVPAGAGVVARTGTWSTAGSAENIVLRFTGFFNDATEDVLVLFNGCLDGASCTSCGYGFTREGVAGLQLGSYKITDGEAPSVTGLTGIGLLTGGGAFASGANVFLFPEVSGNPSRYTFKWFKDDVAIPGASQSFLSLSSLRAEDSGVYSVEISAAGNKAKVSTRVTVDAPGAPSGYLGRPWVKVVDQATVVPGTTAPMGGFAARQMSLRNGVVAVRDSNGKSLIKWSAQSALESVITEGAPLPGGRTLQVVIEATAESEGAINFFARHNTGYGVYEIKNGVITQITGVGSPTPNGSSNFTGFLWLARRDGRLVFSASNNANQVGVYLWDGTQLSTLLEPGADLPGLLGAISQALELDLDAQTVVLRANDSVPFQGNNRQGIYRHTAGKGWTEVANVTQPLPGTPSSVYKWFTGVDIVSGTIVYAALPPQGVQIFASDPVGKPRFIGHGFSADLVSAQFSASTPITIYQRYVQSLQSMSPVSSEQILGPGHLLGTQILSEVLDVVSQGTDVAIVARLSDGTTGVFAAVGTPPSNTPIVLGAPAFSQGKLSFQLQTRAGITYQVEFKSTFTDPSWTVQQTVIGDGSSRTVTVDTAGTAGFCRVVQSSAP